MNTVSQDQVQNWSGPLIKIETFKVTAAENEVKHTASWDCTGHVLMKPALLQIVFANCKCIHASCIPVGSPSLSPSPSQHFPVTSAINSASPGLQSRSQRLGVIPLVLF